MKNLAIFCAVLLGCAAVASATTYTSTVLPTIYTFTPSQNDNYNVTITETMTPNVYYDAADGIELNEIDVWLGSIGGTYSNGTATVPASAYLTGFSGEWTFPGGACYLPGTSSAITAPLDGQTASNGTGHNAYMGGPGVVCGPTGGSTSLGGLYTYTHGTHAPQPNYNFAPGSAVNFDSLVNSAFTAPGYLTTNDVLGIGASGDDALVSSFDMHASTAWPTTCGIYSVAYGDPTPNGTFGVTGTGTTTTPTGYMFDNNLLASFFVTQTTTAALLGPEGGVGTPAQGTSTNYGGANQFQYGGVGNGRTSWVYMSLTPEPTTLALLASGLFGLLAYAWKRRR